MSNIQIKVGILIEKKGSLVLLEEWSNKKNGYFWNIVKGTYGDVQGEDLFECALRECQEEIGMEVKLKKIVLCSIENFENNKFQFDFLANPLKGQEITMPKKKEQESRGEDIREIKWFDKNEVKKIKQEQFISRHSFLAVRRWLDGKNFPLSFIFRLN